MCDSSGDSNPNWVIKHEKQASNGWSKRVTHCGVRWGCDLEMGHFRSLPKRISLHSKTRRERRQGERKSGDYGDKCWRRHRQVAGMTTTRFKGMCFFPKLALPFFMFSPSPSHSITSPVHPTAINSTASLACSSPTSEMARTMATEGHLRNGSMAQAGVVGGHLRNGAGGAHLGGWGRGGAVRAHLTWKQEWLGPVDQAPLTGVCWRYDFFCLFSSSHEHSVASFGLQTVPSPLEISLLSLSFASSHGD
jgi:hypothetical protein